MELTMELDLRKRLAAEIRDLLASDDLDLDQISRRSGVPLGKIRGVCARSPGPLV
jgi:hypothetical protein